MSDVPPDPASADDADRRYQPEASPFQARPRASLLRRTFPVSANLSGYPNRSARHDVIAGLTIAALALPSGMAFAELAGLSPVAGLYALLLPVVAYTIFGSSRQLIVGPEGALALLVATAVAPLAGEDPSRYAALAAMLAVLIGAIAVVGRIVRLGWIADYFSRAVLVGYLHGIVIVLITGQLGKLFGLSISARDPIPQMREFIEEVTDAHALTVAVAFVSLATVLVLRWKAPRVPGPLVVVLGGIAVSAVFGLADHGVAVVGNIPPGLPSFEWPSVGLDDVVDLLPAALGMFAVAYADGILTARSFAGRNNQHVDANQELLALGTANLAAGVTQGFPVGASGSRTAVNDQIGGRTQLVGLVSAAVIVVVLLFLTAPVEKLPTACLGAVIVAAALGIADPGAWRALARAGRSQVVIAVITLAGVVIVGVLEALVVAVALSIVDVVMRSARPHDAVLGYVERLGRWANVSLHPSARVEPGIVVYRLDSQLLFANARYFKGRVREAIAGAPTLCRYLVFDAEGLTGIDASGVEAVEQLLGTLRRADIVFAVARLKSPIEKQFTATKLTEEVGDEHFFPTVQAAVDWCQRHGSQRPT
jgi:high affinity sulfate transporter 1